MGNHRKTIVFSILIICISLMPGFGEKQNQSQKGTFSKSIKQEIKDAKTTYANELNDITNVEEIVILDDKPCQTGWVPQKSEDTLSEITTWLQQANLYKSEIPKPKNLKKNEVVFHGYIGPSILNITTSNNHKIAVKPAYYIDKDDRDIYSTHYIDNVLEFEYDGRKSYIQSNLLYDWLKNDNWKTEFKQ